MLKLILCLSLVVPIIGCSYLRSTTKEPVIIVQGTNAVVGYNRTTVRAYTLFDSQSALTKFQNRGVVTRSNEWANGTSIGQLNQAASSTNLNSIISDVVGAAVKAAVKP